MVAEYVKQAIDSVGDLVGSQTVGFPESSPESMKQPCRNSLSSLKYVLEITALKYSTEEVRVPVLQKPGFYKFEF